MGKQDKNQGKVEKKGIDMPLRDIEQEVELTEDNCSPELWEKLGGKSIAKDDDLPF